MISKARNILILIAVFVISSVILQSIVTLFIVNKKNDDMQRYEYIASDRAGYIETCIDRVLIRTSMIPDLIYHYNGDISFFDETSRELYDRIKSDTGVSIKSITAAPKNIVEKVYPLSDNIETIGIDLTDETVPGSNYAKEAYTTGKTTISEPFEFIQGGFGIEAYTPVYTDKDGRKTYWGIVSVTMDFFDLLECFEIEKLDEVGLDYALWYNESGEKLVLVSEDSGSAEKVTAPIKVGNMEWFLSIAPSAGWYSEKLGAVLAVFALLLSVVITLLVSAMLRLKSANKSLKSMAVTDPLTDCYSRAYLHMNIVDTANFNRANGKNIYSLALVDIDNLKSINDSFGHLAGDRAINSIAQVLKRNVDDACGDCVVRFGGDEFIILWNRVAQFKLETCLEKIIYDVNKTVIEGFDDLKLSVSIGAVYNDGTKEASYDQLFKCADAMVYESKNAGRNCFTIKVGLS